MFCKSNEIKRYHFVDNDGYKHYIDTHQTLGKDEQKLLSRLLASFPHASNHHWPKAFATLDTENIPKKLLSIAANAYDVHGNTVLGVAAEYGQQVEALQRLINMGAHLDTPDHNMNKLALHWAINNKLSFNNQDSYEAVEVVKCLLDNGARTDITCYQNMTPLEYAKNRGFKAAANLIEESMAERKNSISVPGVTCH